jgi:GH25 family lysozyme M1 (1,4-beta-N-acetylmuramidase)
VGLFVGRTKGVRACRSRRLFAPAAVAVLVLLAAAPVRAADSTRGLDVSRWNPVSSWPRVAAAGYGFAFVKATEGTRITDPLYTRYRAGASAVGLRVGAYHFARPAGRTRAAQLADARAEAAHFAAVARPHAGDLFPVLDLEKTGGLGSTALIAWTSAWLQAVEQRLQVQPLIYSSPRFWQTAMADTTDFGDGGYPLWVARWTRAPLPALPGLDWADFGWTFWQWTSCGRVPGIRGCVDLDRFGGDDLSSVLFGDEPSNVDQPAVTGSATVGKTLTAVPGSWLGSPGIRFVYAWVRCDALGANCRPIPGATAPRYAVRSVDRGSTIVVTVTGTNRVGSQTAASDPTALVR